jgi:tRNA(Ile)-lysidine synthase
LLAAAAEAAGTDIVLTGHTLDDQIETVAMRRARGTGRGLAGMAPATLHRGRTWILRPLTETGRETLRDYLRLKGVSWIEDPSNDNLRYERARTRRSLARPDGSCADGPLDGLRRAQAERVALGEKAAGLVDRHLSRPAPGLYRIEREFFGAADSGVALYAFRILLAAVGGVEYLPGNSSTAALFAGVRGKSMRATLSRTLVDARKRHVFLCRERRGLPGAGPVSDGMIWDGRFRLKVSKTVPGSILIMPGVAATKDRIAGYDAPAAPVAAALAAEPVVVLRRESVGREVAGIDPAVEIAPVVAPFLDFLPSFDIALAKALAGLTGGGVVPVPPLADRRRAA